jgi:hypothetical protein
MIIFGGFNGTAYLNLNDVWVLESADGLGGTPRWTQLSPVGAPPEGRNAMSCVYDAVSRRLIVFGGTRCCPSTRPYFNDVWILTEANGLGGTSQWIQLNPAGAVPPGTCGHTAEYDPLSKRMMVFGGIAASEPWSNEVWILENADETSGPSRWSQLNPAGDRPTPRGREVGTPASAYDRELNRLVIFGGYTSGYQTTNDTWVLGLANGVPEVTWTSSDPTVATVDAAALATPTGQGYAKITVCRDGLCADTWLFVTNMPPVVTKPPMNQSVRNGAEASWCVAVEGSQPMTLQWQRNGENISGATGNCLTISNASPANAGLYSLVISNPFGTNTVQAALSLVDLKMFAGLIISGPPGHYRIDSLENLGGTNTWTILGTIPVTAEQMPFYYFDTNSPAHTQRFYRAVWQP